MGDAEADIDALHRAGFVLAATLVAGGDDVFASPLPSRLVLVMGAEQGFSGGINKKAVGDDVAVPAAAMSADDVTIDDLPF